MPVPVDLVLLFIGVTACLVASVEGNDYLNCPVCRSVVDEAFYMISQVDPKKTVQTGSFRVDSHGNQARYEIPYARSETHLTELFEEICSHMHRYGVTRDSTGRKTITRTSTKDGKSVKLTGVLTDTESIRKIKAACDSLLEEHEEDMVTVFKESNFPQDVVELKVCVEISEFCTEDELSIPLPTPEIEDEGDVIKDLEKRLAETATKSVDPTPEDTMTTEDTKGEGQADSEAHSSEEPTDKTEL